MFAAIYLFEVVTSAEQLVRGEITISAGME
jgi:hypothetical protein